MGLFSRFNRAYPEFQRTRHFSKSYNASPGIPLPIMMLEFFCIFFMAAVLIYLVIHEMGPGQRGDPTMIGFYMSHGLFGICFPVIVAFVFNKELYHGRLINSLLIIASSIFYSITLFSSSFSTQLALMLFSLLLALNTSFIYYLFCSDRVKAYYLSLKS